jgi:hypothetical protein
MDSQYQILQFGCSGACHFPSPGPSIHHFHLSRDEVLLPAGNELLQYYSISWAPQATHSLPVSINAKFSDIDVSVAPLVVLVVGLIDS